MPLTDLDATAGDTLRCLAGHMRVDPVVSELEAVELKTWGHNDRSLLEALLAGHESVTSPRSEEQISSPEGRPTHNLNISQPSPASSRISPSQPWEPQHPGRASVAFDRSQQSPASSHTKGSPSPGMPPYPGRFSVESHISQQSPANSHTKASPSPAMPPHPGRHSVESMTSQHSPGNSQIRASPAQEVAAEPQHPGRLSIESQQSAASRHTRASVLSQEIPRGPEVPQRPGHPVWSPGLLRREAPGGVEVALQSPPGRSARHTPESAHRSIDLPPAAPAASRPGQAEAGPADSAERASQIPAPRARASSLSRAGVPPQAPSNSAASETPTLCRPRRQPSAERLRAPPRPASTDARRRTPQSGQTPPTESRASSSGPRRRSSGALPPSFSPAPRSDDSSVVEAAKAAAPAGGRAVRSNRKLVRNALEKCCLKGDVNKELRDNVLQAFDTELAAFERFVIVFRSVHTGRYDIRALYRYQDCTWVLSWNALPSPRVLEENMVAQRLQYNSAVKDFREVLATQEIQHVADAIFMRPEFLVKRG